MKFLKALLVIAMVTAGVSIITAMPASAIASDCVNHQCVFTSANYTGSHQSFTLSVGQCVNLAYPFVESVSSLWNGTGQTVFIADGYGCTGTWWQFNLHGGNPNLTGAANNSALSVKRTA
jgi:hypothetical protein